LKPVFTSHGEGASEVERIRIEIEKMPAGMFKTEDGKLDPGMAYDNGSVPYEDLED
jgi:hypothetical protein